MSDQVAYVSTFLPQKCGIATFTYNLRQNVQKARHDALNDTVVVIKDPSVSYKQDSFFKWSIEREKRRDYVKAAEAINASPVAVVSLQHEFGIFGGEAGNYILDFIRHLKKPLVTTFHTVFNKPLPPYEPVQREIAARSDRIVVMNHKAVGYLMHSFAIPKDKIMYIPHGTPIPDLTERSAFRDQLGWSQRAVVMTFGFISRNKGIEQIIRALPEVARKVPNVLYVIAGQTHPNIRKQEGETYRNELETMIDQLGMQDHVLMINQFLSDRDLVRYITASDLYVTPYPGLDQITSGTLAYAVGLGRPVLTTPYRHAQDLLKGLEELFVPYADHAAWSRKMIALLSDHSLWTTYQQKIAHIGMGTSWPQVGRKYHDLFLSLTTEPVKCEESVREADRDAR